MTTDQLEAFLMVSERRKLTEAARRLGSSQPALSRQLQALERELGVRLFVRTSRGAALTEAGERFLPFAREAVTALREGSTELRAIAQTPRGPVSLGTLPTIGAYLLPDLVPSFLQRNPEIELRLTEALPELLKEAVANGELDLAMFELPLRRQDLVAQKLWEEPYHLVVPKAHRLAGARGPVPLSAVVGERLVVIPGSGTQAALRTACESRGEEPLVALEVNHPESLLRMVERGVGIALLPELMTKKAPRASFVALQVEAAPRRTIALVHRGERSLTYGARALKRFIVEQVRPSAVQRTGRS